MILYTNKKIPNDVKKNLSIINFLSDNQVTCLIITSNPKILDFENSFLTLKKI